MISGALAKKMAGIDHKIAQKWLNSIAMGGVSCPRPVFFDFNN